MVRSIGGALSRAKSWWRCRPLGTVYVVYLASYLAIATAGTAAILTFVDARQSIYMTVEVDAGSGELQRAIVESGPYIYDEAADELIPATEIGLPGDNPYAVFVGVKHDCRARPLRARCQRDRGARGARGRRLPGGRCDDGPRALR